MANLTDIKKVINEELRDFTVDSRLKSKTMSRIFKKGLSLSNYRSHIMRFFTSVASFIIVFSISFSVLLGQNQAITKEENDVRLFMEEASCPSNFYSQVKVQNLQMNQLPLLDDNCLQTEKKGE